VDPAISSLIEEAERGDGSAAEALVSFRYRTVDCPSQFIFRNVFVPQVLQKRRPTEVNPLTDNTGERRRQTLKGSSKMCIYFHGGSKHLDGSMAMGFVYSRSV
jgi:hypothetical protein